jgi:VIT1/CCC1 family predicted Fe2+/Mn2+ transporter
MPQPWLQPARVRLSPLVSGGLPAAVAGTAILVTATLAGSEGTPSVLRVGGLVVAVTNAVYADISGRSRIRAIAWACSASACWPRRRPAPA